MKLEIEARDGMARSGVFHTPHGAVVTPAFMPVGTRGSVKTLDGDDLENVGAQMVLSNTFHLMLRPGSDVVRELGGLHEFMNWRGPILTDSGGYQVFSLDAKVSENGVTFRSTYDGSRIELTPERAVTVQEDLGSDIAVALDVLVGLPAPRPVVEAAMQRTLRWAARSMQARRREDQLMFGIVQGGVDLSLRAESAAKTAALEFDGYAVGGLSVGESDAARDKAIEVVVGELPQDRVRYTMGLGDTEGMLHAVARGIDLFDCVLPTRLARHGKVLTSDGDYSIRRAEHTRSSSPLDPSCGCRTCSSYSRSYLRHLYQTGEPAGLRLLTMHNLTYTLNLMRAMRSAVVEGRFERFMISTIERRVSGVSGESLA
jgi:queuine tRNA-ribosyltransferase